MKLNKKLKVKSNIINFNIIINNIEINLNRYILDNINIYAYIIFIEICIIFIYVFKL